MKTEFWQQLDDVKNDFDYFRYGRSTSKSLNYLEDKFLSEQCQAQAKYPGHIVWKVKRAWK
jgi:hypothetical protein